MRADEPAAELSRAIAVALGGVVVEVPSEQPVRQLAVALSDGRVPVLVRGFGHTIGANVATTAQWSLRPNADLIAAAVPIAEAARDWAASHPGTATMLDLALEVARAVAADRGERWTVGIPGTVAPTEMWLHGPSIDVASVGVSEGGVHLWIDGALRRHAAPTRGELAGACAFAVGAVREQAARYERHVALGARLEAATEELVRALAPRLPAVELVASIRGRPTYAGAIRASIGWRAKKKRKTAARIEPCEVVTLAADGGAIGVHAGVVGPDGWEGELTSADAILDAVIAAIERALETLTIERLTVGQRYRVLETTQELVAGTIVTYTGLDDIDNHYGRYVFVTSGGVEVAVAGDCSVPRHGPLRELHRILAEVDDDSRPTRRRPVRRDGRRRRHRRGRRARAVGVARRDRFR